jgi:protein required for attachment to host cells
MLHTFCVAVADASRARLFHLEPAELPVLTEVEALVNPERRMRASEVMAESRPGLRQSPGKGGPRHGVDDHRDAHAREVDRKFASLVGEAIAGLHRERGGAVVVVASPAMLGHLRETSAEVLRATAATELARDVTGLSPSELHDYLASESLLPPRQRLQIARR